MLSVLTKIKPLSQQIDLGKKIIRLSFILGDSRNYIPPNVVLVIAKLIERKDFILRGFVCDIIRPSNELFVQSYQLKHKNKM